MGANVGCLQLSERTAAVKPAVVLALSARHNFEDFEFLAIDHCIGDGDRRGAAHNDDGVGANPLGSKDFLDSGGGAGKLDLVGPLVEPAADRDFGRNPSAPCGWQTLKTKTSL